MRSTRFSISLLGQAFVYDSLTDTQLVFPDKGFALVAYLAIQPAGASCHRQQVAAGLWPDSERHKSASSLRSLLIRLRQIARMTGLRLVDSDRHHVWLSKGVPIDLVRVCELIGVGSLASVVELCSLYRGDLLDDIAARSELGSTIANYREALRVRFCQSVTTFLDRADPIDDGSVIQTVATKLIEIDPYQDSAYRALLRVHSAAGRRHELDQVYYDYCKRWELDLGTTPNPTVTVLYRALRGADAVGRADGGPSFLAGPEPIDVGPRDLTGRLPSICILPPLPSSDPAGHSLTAGLLEDLTINLCQQQTFVVIAPHTAWQLGPDWSATGFVIEYGIDYVLQTRLPDRRPRTLAAKLIDIRSRTVIWADRFAADDLELAASQQVMAGRISHSLNDTIRLIELERPPADRSTAYVDYLRGLRALSKLQLPDLRAARSYFRAALRADDRFIPALSGLAHALTTEWLLLGRGDADLLDRSEYHARRALGLASDSPDALRELGRASLYRGFFEDSLARFADAERRAPQHADLIADYADALSLGGSPADALMKIQAALALNPLAPDRYRWNEGTILYQLDRFPEAIDAISQMADPTPAFKLMAACWAMQGETERAQVYARKVLDIYPDFTVDKWLAMIPIRDGEQRERYRQGLRAAGFK
jgi:DNA-binding SARP family transcriptional activator/TolB-like protein